jgi:hypothetical protein
MADRLRSSRLLRWSLATLILVALVLQLSLLFLAHEAHAGRARVRVTFSAENAIVQVLVECRLAYSFRGERASNRTIDLGWLKTHDILTFQARSRKHLGYFELSYSRGTRATRIVRRGSPGHPGEIPESRAVYADSWGVGGEHLGAIGCQKDVRHLAFADPHARNWSDGAARRLESVTTVAALLPRILAILALVGLGALWLVGQVWRGRSNARTGVRVLLALAELAVLLFVSIAAQALDLVFALSVAIAVGSLVTALLWLLKEDIHRITEPSH